MSGVEGPAKPLRDEILAVIEAWHERGTELSDDEFSDLALRIVAYQLQSNEPYARYCAAKGVTRGRMPRSWREITPVPAAAYKEALLATFDPATAALTFETSGTTEGKHGKHYMESSELYDAALLAGFDRFMLPDDARLHYLNLVPNPAEKPHSSLGYMMARVAESRGSGRTGWYVRGDALLLEKLFEDLRDTVAHAQSVCIAATAFALLAFLDAAEAQRLRFPLPPGSRIMETGGFKGRTRTISRDELYARTAACFGIPESHVVAEYGMTELTSQWYDAIAPAGPPTAGLRPFARDDKPQAFARDDKARRKLGPTWLRARAVAPDGTTLPDGVVGALAHVDLANLWSCVAVQTQDLGACFGREVVLIGREHGAELRGCSLDAESLAAR